MGKDINCWKENIMTAISVAPKQNRTSSVENVGDLAAALEGALCIPDVYVQPEGLRPNVPYDGFSEETDLVPAVDLHDIIKVKPTTLDAKQKTIKCIGYACKEWGFFQVINHGVPRRLIQKLKELAGGFFQLPTAEKERASVGQVGYEGRHAYMPERVHWVETLTFISGPNSNVKDILKRTSSKNSEEIFTTVNEYIYEMQTFGLQILELMAESLNLEKGFFTQHFEKESTSVTRFNYYPPCPQPSMALGLFPHVDSNCITILCQDEIGGLQILKDEKWVSVRPLKDALVVNVGDCLQAWTNGQFKSVEHRAVLNSMKPRLSMAFFQSPNALAVMAPPVKLVDEKHPLLYRPFTWAEYFPRMQKKRMEGKVGVDTFMRLDHQELEVAKQTVKLHIT